MKKIFNIFTNEVCANKKNSANIPIPPQAKWLSSRKTKSKPKYII